MKVPPFSLLKQIAELGDDLDSAVIQVLRSGQYIGGEQVSTFERNFAKLIQVPYSIGCNSGTDALVIALRALDIGNGDEVITPSFSFFATAEAISLVGAHPVFVDVDPDNYLIDLNKIEKLISKSTKAIIPVHLFGRPVNMERLMDLASFHKLKVIEDCAQACGAKWKNRPVGSWGDVGCFSFFPTKNLGAAGDGGAITVHDIETANRIRQLAIHGMPKRYLHSEFGYNSRLDALQAAVLNIKLPYLQQWLEKRNSIANTYQNSLIEVDGIELPKYPENEEKTFHSWNQYVIKLKNSQERSVTDVARNLLKVKLQELGISTIIYYPIPIHLQPAYKSLNHTFNDLSVTEDLCKRVLSLPIFPELSLEEQRYVCDNLKSIMKEYKNDQFRKVA